MSDNRPKPQYGIRCKDCRYGTRGPEGICCSINGGLYPLHPELFCADAEADDKAVVWKFRTTDTKYERR